TDPAVPQHCPRHLPTPTTRAQSLSVLPRQRRQGEPMFRRLHTLLLAPLVLAALVLMPVAPVHAAPPGEAGPPDDSAPPGQGAAEVSDMQVIPALKEWHA